MSQITPDILRECVHLLAPLLATVLDRRNLLLSSVGQISVLDSLSFEGSAKSFVTNMVNHMDQFGRLDNGELALVCVLKTASEERGTDYQLRFEALIQQIITPHSQNNVGEQDRQTAQKKYQSLIKKYIKNLDEEINGVFEDPSLNIVPLSGEDSVSPNALPNSIFERYGVTRRMRQQIHYTQLMEALNDYSGQMLYLADQEGVKQRRFFRWPAMRL